LISYQTKLSDRKCTPVKQKVRENFSQKDPAKKYQAIITTKYPLPNELSLSYKNYEKQLKEILYNMYMPFIHQYIGE
jgi:hypothetical protein